MVRKSVHNNANIGKGQKCLNKRDREGRVLELKKKREYQRQWRKENRDKCREYDKRQYQKNRKKILAKRKKYARENPELMKQRWKDYYSKPENAEKHKKQARQYYAENKELIAKKAKPRRKKYRVEQKEHLRELRKAEYQRNKEKIKKRVKEWRKTPKGKLGHQKSNHIRRAKCKDTDITSDWLLALKENTNVCPLCGTKMDDDGRKINGKTLDHIISLISGGKHIKINVRYICRKCNVNRPQDNSDLLEEDKNALVKKIEEVEL